MREIWYSKSVETSSGTQIPLLLDLAFASNVHYLDTVKSHKIFFVHSITIKKFLHWYFDRQDDDIDIALIFWYLIWYFDRQDVHEGDRDFRDTLPFASGAATCRGILDSLVSAGDDLSIRKSRFFLLCGVFEVRCFWCINLVCCCSFVRFFMLVFFIKVCCPQRSLSWCLYIQFNCPQRTSTLQPYFWPGNG